ncbi:hypothetical protein G6675_06085 [Polynucleobacter paneuropaeus]|nr:hypothetical protein [Polynucleobacter paneuropaeus]MBT8600508.1 hypothetical protein [Polynucleobacter paneuropaeus]
MNDLIKLFFTLTILGFFSIASADAEGEMWGRKAGDYYGSVVMANEFKNNICGPYLNVPSTWTDVSYARQNILKKLPTKYHKEFNVAFNQNYEIDLRRSVKSDLSPKNTAKCQELADGFRNLIAPRINNW